MIHITNTTKIWQTAYNFKNGQVSVAKSVGLSRTCWAGVASRRACTACWKLGSFSMFRSSTFDGMVFQTLIVHEKKELASKLVLHWVNLYIYKFVGVIISCHSGRNKFVWGIQLFRQSCNYLVQH